MIAVGRVLCVARVNRSKRLPDGSRKVALQGPQGFHA
jgi:hypothetical protein